MQNIPNSKLASRGSDAGLGDVDDHEVAVLVLFNPQAYSHLDVYMSYIYMYILVAVVVLLYPQVHSHPPCRRMKDLSYVHVHIRCAHMYMYVYVYMDLLLVYHTCMIHVCIICVSHHRLHAYIHTYTCTWDLLLCMHVYVYVYVYTCICMYVCIYVCAYVCIYIDVCMHV